MAKIKWHNKAKRAFKEYVEYACLEFGKSTAKRWYKERKEIEWRLERYPSSYTPEELLQEESIIYRRCHLMNRRFKIIYFYDEVKDIVNIMDIWDARMNPKTLVQRIK